MKGHCPICRKAYEIKSISELPSFPFCSDRCRLLDLGRWIDGAYAVPGAEAGGPQGEGPPPITDEDEAD